MTQYGVCSNMNCGSWGVAPLEFREKIHFLRCKCNSSMYLTNDHPRNAGYKIEKQVKITVFKHNVNS